MLPELSLHYGHAGLYGVTVPGGEYLLRAKRQAYLRRHCNADGGGPRTFHCTSVADLAHFCWSHRGRHAQSFAEIQVAGFVDRAELDQRGIESVADGLVSSGPVWCSAAGLAHHNDSDPRSAVIRPPCWWMASGFRDWPLRRAMPFVHTDLLLVDTVALILRGAVLLSV